jgi:hypothetical protein
MRTIFFLAVLLPTALRAQDPRLNCRDGKDAPPRLQIVLNLWGLAAYPSAKEEWTEARKVQEIAAAGFDAFDVWIGGAKEEDFSRWKGLADQHGLAIGVETEILRPEDADAAIEGARRLGSVYLDAHVAGYFTPEAEAEALLRRAVDRFQKANLALAIQTHRGRVTQDLLRAVHYAKAIPDLRFDLDLSHYFVAGSIGGGGILGPEANQALDVLMGRAIMLDGRVSNGEQVQVDHRNPAYASERDRFASMWKDGMKRWLQTARRGDVFPFRIELGPPAYAILGGDGREISDRWEQQKDMKALVERLWNEAVAETGAGQRHGRQLHSS